MVIYKEVVPFGKEKGKVSQMGKPRPIRNRKNEMTSCWACSVFVLIIFIVKNMLMGGALFSTFNIVLMVLFAVWVGISVFYTIQYFQKREKE